MKLIEKIKEDIKWYDYLNSGENESPFSKSIIDYFDDIELLEKENEDLKQQIIELKRCDSCIHDAGFDNECEYFQDNTCTENKEKWELAE